MSGRKGVAKSSTKESAATSSRRGTDGVTANSGTICIGAVADRTLSTIPSGRASTVTEQDTRVHNSLMLNDEEALELLRLRTLRKRGMMLSMGECDWLITVLWRLLP
jgi:hypothetical protein